MVQNNASNLEKKDLVVSNSILRSIDCAKLEKTDVRTLNNSTINDAKETMKAMKRQFKKQHLWWEGMIWIRLQYLLLQML